MSHYLIFGDSISWGEGDSVGGWVQYLRQYLTKDTFYNLSIDAENTSRLLNRFEAELKLRLSEPKPHFIIIALGVNDSAQITLKQFCQNLIQLIKLAKKYTQKIIFIGPAPVDQARVDPCPWDLAIAYKNNRIKAFSHALQAITFKAGIKFIDLFSLLPSEYIQTLDDGLHPNHYGQQMIYKIVAKNLKIC